MSLDRLAIALLAASGLFGCATSGRPAAPAIHRPSEIVANAARFKGRRVTIRGYIVLKDEGHGIWDSRADLDHLRSKVADMDDPAWKRCLTVHYTESGAIGIGRNHPRMLTASGMIGIHRPGGTAVDFGACSDAFIVIDYVLPDAAP